MTSYRLFLLRAALGRMGRAIAYYWVTMRAQLRALRSSYALTLLGYRIRGGTAATGKALRRLPRRLGSMLGLIAWFFGQLGPYVARVLADRREDRAELRAERRLMAAERRAQKVERQARRAERRGGRLSEVSERRARRRAELAEIKANRTRRPHHLPVPAWISRQERPERPQVARRVPAPRRAMLAAALTMAAAVPAYSVVSGVLSSDDLNGVVPDVAAAPGAAAAPGTAAADQPAAPAPGVPAGPSTPVTVSGDTGEFVRTLPPLPTPTPAIPAQRLVASLPIATTPVSGMAVVGSLTNPLTEHQQREARRQAKWEAKLARAERAADKADDKADGK